MGALLTHLSAMSALIQHDISSSPTLAEADAKAGPPARDSAWRTLPFEGVLKFAYLDSEGKGSLRRLVARELKIGPGKVLLCGIDFDLEVYRAFRADRIRMLEDAESGTLVERNVLDWLVDRGERLDRARRRAEAAAERAAAKRMLAVATAG